MFSKNEKSILSILFLINFCLIMDFMIVMPLGPQIMRILEISAKEFSRIVAVYTLGASLAGFLSFFYLKSQARSLQLRFGLIGFIILGVGNFLAGGYTAFLVTRLLTGLIVGFLGAVQLSVVSEFIDLKKRATALGIIMSAFALASIVGVPIGVTLGNKISWSAPFLFVAVTALFIFMSLLKWLPPLSHEKDSATESVRVREVLKEILASKAGLLMIFTLIFSNFLIVPFLFPAIIINGKVAESELPVIYLFGGLASILASVLFGKLSDKFGHKPLFAVGVFTSMVAIYFATNIQPFERWVLVVIVMAYFASTAGRLVPAMTMVTSVVRLPIRSRYMSLVTSLQHLAAALAAVAAGLIAKKIGNEQIENLPQLGYFAIAVSGISLLFVVGVRKSQDSEEIRET